LIIDSLRKKEKQITGDSEIIKKNPAWNIIAGWIFERISA